MAGEGHEIQVSWIVVCHESRHDLGVLLPSLNRALDDLQGRGLACELIIVDSASSDGSVGVARELAPRARVLGLEENRGYGAAVNRAAELARGRWLVVGNADLYVPEGGLADLPRVLAEAPGDVAVVGPAVHASHGPSGLSAGRFPTLATLLAGLLRACHRRKYLHERRHRAGAVDWVTGACQFVRRDVFEAVGGFDPDFFLYYEDVDLARRLVERGHRSWYEPALAVVHVRPHHGRPPSPVIEAAVRRSRRVYFRKHRPDWEQRLLGVLTRLEPFARSRSRLPAAPVASLPVPEREGRSRGSRQGVGEDASVQVPVGVREQVP